MFKTGKTVVDLFSVIVQQSAGTCMKDKYGVIVTPSTHLRHFGYTFSHHTCICIMQVIFCYIFSYLLTTYNTSYLALPI